MYSGEAQISSFSIYFATGSLFLSLTVHANSAMYIHTFVLVLHRLMWKIIGSNTRILGVLQITWKVCGYVGYVHAKARLTNPRHNSQPFPKSTYDTLEAESI